MHLCKLNFDNKKNNLVGQLLNTALIFTNALNWFTGFPLFQLYFTFQLSDLNIFNGKMELM